jgi:MFS family permease
VVIYGAGLLRGLAAGAISVLAAVFLAKRGFPEVEIGVVLASGLAGVLAGTIYGTFFAERVGRRRSLMLLAALAAAGGCAFALADSLWCAVLAAFVGMLNTQAPTAAARRHSRLRSFLAS